MTIDIITQIKMVADTVRAVDPDDDQLLADMIEAETDLDGVLDMLLDREATIDGHLIAIAEREKTLKERKARFRASQDAGRAAMLKLLHAAGLRKVERPEGTVSLSRVAPKVMGDNVDGLPDDLVRVKREPDKTAIKQALSEGRVLDGWALSNGDETVTVRRK